MTFSKFSLNKGISQLLDTKFPGGNNFILFDAINGVLSTFSNLYWPSFIAQLVNNLPEMQEILVQFLGQEDLLEKG